MNNQILGNDDKSRNILGELMETDKNNHNVRLRRRRARAGGGGRGRDRACPVPTMAVPRIHLLLIIIFALVTSCEKPDRNNPWDDLADIDPASWAPKNLEIETMSITSKKLTWQYDGDERIEGFQIDKKAGDADWEKGVVSLGKEAREWLDTNVLPDTSIAIQYRVYTIAGNNQSSEIEGSTNGYFPEPENLEIEKITEVSYELNWTNPFSGEQGIRIDRRVGENDWELAFAELEAGQINYTDTNVFLPKTTKLMVEYRVYGFHGDYHSQKSYVNTQASLSAPFDLEITINSVSSVTLNWIEPDSNNDSKNYKIERKYSETDEWIQIATTQVTEYTDDDFELNSLVYYRVTSFVGDYESIAFAENSFDATITEPTSVVPTVHSNNAIELSWIYESTGIQGFKIDRQRDDESWQNEMATISTEGTSYTDISVNLEDHGYRYRIYAYYEQYESPKIQIHFEKPTVVTNQVTNINFNSATCHGNVTSWGSSSVIDYGFVYSTTPNPTQTDNIVSVGNGFGSFSEIIDGLQTTTTYFVRAYATNSVGTAYGEQVQFETLWFNVVTNPATGKIWMDRNLGASRAATSSTDAQAYGDLYQWGRGTDGHQIRTSGTTSTLSSSNTPGHGNFITVNSSPYDWRSPQNDNLWQGVSGTNNPCPAGYRLPTVAEWNAERLSWSSNNAAGAFASPLQLPVAGYRLLSNGSLYNVGSYGHYWSSTVSGSNSHYLLFHSSFADMYSKRRAYGYSVRCLKD